MADRNKFRSVWKLCSSQKKATRYFLEDGLRAGAIGAGAVVIASVTWAPIAFLASCVAGMMLIHFTMDLLGWAFFPFVDPDTYEIMRASAIQEVREILHEAEMGDE